MKKICTKTFAWVIALMALCFVLPMGALALDGDGQGGSAANEGTEAPRVEISVALYSDVEAGTTVGVGDTIHYVYWIQNTGNVPYTAHLSDELVGWSCDFTLTPGQTYSAALPQENAYTVTEEDLQAGSVTNTLTATIDPIEYTEYVDGQAVTKHTDTVTKSASTTYGVGDVVNKSLSIVKKSTEDKAYGQGQVIRYSITVKNTGNQTLTGIVITDSNASAVIGEGTGYTVENNTAKIASLEPDATVTVNASYTVTCDDIKAGKVDNTVTATLNEDATINITPATDKVVDLDTSLTVMTFSDATASVGLGQLITYTIAVVNDGNVPYTNVVVVDELAKFTTTIDTLAVSESRVFTVQYVVTSDDILKGSIVNTVTAKADSINDPKSGEDKTPEGSDEAIDFTDDVDASLTVEKTIINAKTDGTPYKLGETINYSITVQNNSNNVPLTNVIVKDELTGLEETIPTLAVDAKKTFTTSYTVQESDLGRGDYGKVTNTVIASGTVPKAADPERQPADPIATSSIDAKTSIRLVITANDSTVTYDANPHGGGGYTVTGLKKGHDLTVTINGTATDAATYTDLLVPSDAKIMEGDKDVTSHYEITYVPGTLVIEQAPIEKYVTLTTTDVEETYDGNAHSAGTATAVDANENELKIEYSADGENWTTDPSTITAKKVSDSKTVQVRVSSKNYKGYVTGEQALTIGKKPVTITADSASREYNGQPFTKDSYTITDLAEGDYVLAIDVDGEITYAWENRPENNVASDAVIGNAAGESVTDCYDITYVNGTLEIKGNTTPIKVVANSTEWEYDGTERSDGGYTVLFGDETYAVKAGESATLSTGDKVTAVVAGKAKNMADTAEGNNKVASATVENEDQYCGGIDTKHGTLRITAREITVTAKDVTVEYDSQPHGADGYTLDNMDETNTVKSVTIEGEQSDAAVYVDELRPTAIEIVDADGEDVTKNYKPKFIPGTLEITAVDEDDSGKDDSASDDADENDADKDSAKKDAADEDGADKDDESAAGEASDGTPKTGDATNALLPVGMIAVAGGAMVLAMRARRRGQE